MCAAALRRTRSPAFTFESCERASTTTTKSFLVSRSVGQSVSMTSLSSSSSVSRGPALVGGASSPILSSSRRGMRKFLPESTSLVASAGVYTQHRAYGCSTNVGSVARVTGGAGGLQALVRKRQAQGMGRGRAATSASRRVARMCGIIGVFKHGGNANVEIYEGLLMLQHRGQDSAGMVTTDGTLQAAVHPVDPACCSLAHSLGVARRRRL